jgi:hypothetical protein
VAGSCEHDIEISFKTGWNFQLLIQYIHNYPPNLEAVSSIRNPRTRHAVLTGLTRFSAEPNELGT